MLMFATLVPATAPAGAGTWIDRLPAHARARMAEVRADVATVRAAMAEGSFLARTRGLLEAGGEPVPAVPALPRPSAADLAAVQGLAAPLRAPLAGLSAAVRRATSLFDRFREEPSGRALRAALRGPLGLPEAESAWTGYPHGSRPGIPAPQAALPSIPRGEHDPVAGRAALLVAAALDRYLPAIRATVPPRGGGRRVEGCDVVDLLPHLCVGGVEENTYTEDAALLIDLGGNDTYRNSAGGSYWATPTGFGMFVSVNVDLGGDDRYLAERRFVFPGRPGHLLVGQGGAWGGVGLLVDALGDDVYEAVASATSPTNRISQTIVQGAAAQGVVPSFGGLMDLGGDDRYLAVAPDGTDEAVVYAQGAAALVATVAGLVDVGVGSDTYTIDAGVAIDAAVGSETWPLHAASGQGMGSVGSAALFDDGGRDDFTLAASARWVGQDRYPLFGEDALIPRSSVVGQGAAGIGTGLLLTGPGNTTYTAEALSEGMARNDLRVQGYGFSGVGVLEDPGGDDRYLARGAFSYDRTVTVDDSCTTTDPETGETIPCTRAGGFVHAYQQQGFLQLVYGQGFGSFGGTGLLEDHLGDDMYDLLAEARLDATLRDEMTAPDGPPTFDVSGYGLQWNIGQGMGQGYGYGLLTDHSGSDTYTARASTVTTASATSEHAPGTPRVTALHPYRNGMWNQGVGYGIEGVGALVDLGGSNDRFDVASVDSVTTEPDTGGALLMSLGRPLAQGAAGAGNATGLFVAAGQDPRISSGPARGVCAVSPFPRGYGTWVDCALEGEDPGQQNHDYRAVTPAVGTAPAAVGTAPALVFTADTPDGGTWGYRLGGEDGSRVDVGARLLGAGGAPLEGETVHFSLQAKYRAGDLYYGVWYGTWEAEATTGPDGVARASLPLEWTGGWGVDPSTYDFRLLATYDGKPGRPGLYPRHVSHPFQVTEGT